MPLLAGDLDIDLHLQEVLNRAYDLGNFQYLIDYREEPDVRLSADWAAWCDQRLREAGKRP